MGEDGLVQFQMVMVVQLAGEVVGPEQGFGDVFKQAAIVAGEEEELYISAVESQVPVVERFVCAPPIAQLEPIQDGTGREVDEAFSKIRLLFIS